MQRPESFFGVFQLLHCKISGMLVIAKPSQQLLSMGVALMFSYIFISI